jgi:hypothetical protein
MDEGTILRLSFALTPPLIYPGNPCGRQAEQSRMAAPLSSRS